MLKKILIVIGALLAIGAIVLAFVLVPAHLQIRDVEPELPTKAELLALADSPDGPTKISYFRTSTQNSADRSLTHSTFVVEWEDGKILLIDLGMDAAVAVEFGALFETIAGADPAVPLGTVPEIMGDDLDRVQGVGFTHLHLDHVQGIEPICAARSGAVSVLQTPEQKSTHNLHTQEQADMLAGSACVTQIELADGSRTTDQFPGIGIYPLGGHTPGSTMFAIPVDGKLWLLTGDISNVQSDLLNDRGKGFIYSYLMVPENVDRLAMLRPWLIDLNNDPMITALVSHDGKALADSGLEQWQRSAQQ
ncbi:MBL fold metallo-hydrolase [Pontixanthobacter aestiaquae]|uniref:MBL fold metallo-hydrolase n=1 Tax=Pontixanthobacter aestiaquae TaxID=1509367 RepID=A0A844Z873_9SPHN|nr:MBL fold metallo-hydrolase [Pontixanthobacter aestiaquae]MDN3645479.1 MBL fold metallo-hydrolase [Pontixanthobacter aestiaquae]MXO83522.1 MBL fold metallo-hydrolase [Pontixanthobacter aestiaquae]